ncbi:MAG: hypothetical protein IJQ58_02160 [Synergistaceae bacterium]|nr:hypothetical protein [Synergistaceae bacterium]
MAVYNPTPHHTTNFFSPQDNFFIIDSEHLSDVTSKFYGFSVQESGVYDRHNITQEALAGLDGTGTYVSIERAGDEILIRQDFNGCYRLYVYRDGAQFVLSNSFLYLMEYMSRRVRLTLNRDYANHYLIMGVWSMAYSETFINEIELLPRDVVVKISIPSGTLSTEKINYGENTVRLNSPEGMKILDEWFAKWTGIIKNICETTPNIEADLSGGFDSRIAFALLLNSGADLHKIYIHTIEYKGKAYTLEEDYAIASEVAKHFGFTLNNADNFTGGRLNYSLDDVMNTNFYIRMLGHTQFLRRSYKYEDKHFRLTGHHGEYIRSFLHPADSSFMYSQKAGARFFSGALKKELAASMERIVSHMFDEICRKTGSTLSDDLAPHVVRETDGRNHHGAEEALYVPDNIYMLSPLSDAGLNRLKLDDENCRDKNLLIATIFTRYAPELLKLPFIKARVLSPDTLKFAEKICASFPKPEISPATRDFSFVPRDPEVSALLEHNNPPLESDAHTKFIKSVYASTATRKLFATCFDEEIYIYAEDYAKRVAHHPLGKCLTIIATADVIKHIIISEGTQERSIADDFREFAESEFVSTTDRRTGKLLRLYRSWRRLASIPGRAVRKIIRIIRRK